MPVFPDHFRNGNDRSIPRSDMSAKPLRYGRLRRFLDRRKARRDGRNGLPVCEEQLKATPTVRGMVAEFARQASVERELRNRDTAPLRRELAGLTAEIEAIESALTSRQEQLNGAQQPITNSLVDKDVAVWRQQHALRELDSARWRLVDKRVQRKKLEADIASRHQQYLDRCNQLAAHTWDRIETYWDSLVQVHLDGEALNQMINKWGPAELSGPLQRLGELEKQIIMIDQSRQAIGPLESD